MTSYGDVLEALAERTVDNRHQLSQSKQQRRTNFVDLYGIPFVAQGDATHPATFYISVSPDLVYFERFAFKFVIQPYTSTVAGISGSLGTVGYTSLSDAASVGSGSSTLNGGISPNPHTHTISGGSASVVYGIDTVNTTSNSWRVKIHGVDITAYLMAQHDGNWITGEGIFPTNTLADEEDFYDILAVASDMIAEGNTANANKLLAPEFKKVEVISDAPFAVTAHLYYKYSVVNR